MDINSVLNKKAKHLEKLSEELRSLQILEMSVDASSSVVERLRCCAEVITDAIDEIASVQGER